MSKSTALIYLGYRATVDFDPEADGSIRWYSAQPQPTDQQILDAIVPAAQKINADKVRSASAKKYAQYASSAPGKDAVYATKQVEAATYSNGGANDGPVGHYMQARMTKTGETAVAVAAEWLAKSAAWNALAAQIDAIHDKATLDINAATTEGQCETIADAAIAEIEAL